VIVGQLSHRSQGVSSISSLLIFNPPSRWSEMPSHIKIPLKLEKVKYENFQDQVDAQIKAKYISECLVSDDDSFTRCYKDLSSIFKEVSKEVFGCTTPFVKQEDIVTNRQIKSIIRELCAISGGIHFKKSGHMAHILLKVTHVYCCAVASFECDHGSFETLLHFLAGKQQLLEWYLPLL